MNVQGAVVIRATVDKTGKVTSMQVVNGPVPLQQIRQRGGGTPSLQAVSAAWEPDRVPDPSDA